ncbi:MAG: hypothetical protein H7844_08180 [Nitrospirae bacterium YQR-1]
MGSNGRHFVVSNDEEGLTDLVSRIKKIGEVTVVMEATSGYERLLKAGKQSKVGIVACMHKLLIIMNSIVKKRQLWSSGKPT